MVQSDAKGSVQCKFNERMNEPTNQDDETNCFPDTFTRVSLEQSDNLLEPNGRLVLRAL